MRICGMPKEKTPNIAGWGLRHLASKPTVGAVLGAEDREAAVHKLWISGPEARPAESESRLGGAEKQAWIWIVRTEGP